MNTQNVLKIRNADGSISYVPAMPAIYGFDGCMLYSSEQVTNATPEQLREMRRDLCDYNNNR